MTTHDRDQCAAWGIVGSAARAAARVRREGRVLRELHRMQAVRLALAVPLRHVAGHADMLVGISVAAGVASAFKVSMARCLLLKVI